ncbi:response regulator [Pseudomonas matsuisoli]|uniref:histidine kinase n=1 Tax=Pseudomonas matsuisoli TaxID=1515666 RepID=A0A917PWR9_9PSED|nr:response regulator [Pseudomonas matsuisoli]GGJ97327.1 ATPase [Pseudomonas matsuisoli]
MSQYLGFERLFRVSPNAYLLLSPERVILDANEAYLSVTGRTIEELSGRTLEEAFPPGPDPSAEERQLLDALDRVVERKQQDNLPIIRYRIPDTSHGDLVLLDRYWSTTLSPILDARGELDAILLSTADITDLHAARQQSTSDAEVKPIAHLAEGIISRGLALQAEGQQLRRVFEQAPGFVCFLRGPEHVFELTNRAYDTLVDGRALIGMPLAQALPEMREQGIVSRLDECYRAGEPFIARQMRVMIQRGGRLEEIFADFVFQPVLGADGYAAGIFIQGQDVTGQKRSEDELSRYRLRLEELVAERTRELARSEAERLQAEQALTQIQKLEAVGKLTGGVAHDFNNVLQVIGGNLQLLKIGKEMSAPSVQRIDSALEAVERGARLASQLLAFARQQPLAPKPVDLGAMLERMSNALLRALGEAVEIEVAIDEGLWLTFVDPGSLESVVLNLAINARDSMEGGGHLTLRARNVVLQDEQFVGHAEVLPGDYVQLSVIDEGCGMSEDVRIRAFEPFFTTKRDGLGSGLGLSMVYGFVKQSGGHITLNSDPGGGTAVVLFLPRCVDGASVQGVQDERGVQGGSERILVVEDDPNVRATSVAILQELGYVVTEARDAVEALDLLRQGQAFDLIFSDVVMPGSVSCMDMAKEARRLLPDVSVLFASGYPENVITPSGRLDEGVELLNKPYGIEQLSRKVRRLLGDSVGDTVHAVSEADTCVAVESEAQSQDEDSGLRILLVEDDATLRMLTGEVISELGHRVDECESGEEALERLQPGAFDVLFTDVGLQGMTGIELIRHARERDPSIKVVVASGYPVNPQEHGLDRIEVMLKPYDVQSVRRLLDRL